MRRVACSQHARLQHAWHVCNVHGICVQYAIWRCVNMASTPPQPPRHRVGPRGPPSRRMRCGGQHACAACAAGLHMHVVHVRIWRGGGGVCAAVRRAANASTGTVQCAWACDVWGCAAGRAQTVHWQCRVMGQCSAAVIARRAGIGRAGGHSPGKIQEKCWAGAAINCSAPASGRCRKLRL